MVVILRIVPTLMASLAVLNDPGQLGVMITRVLGFVWS